MAPEAAGEREELVRLCSSKNWSKAIRVLDSLLARSSSIQDLCNRAFCYSRLELHKHVIKDCDKALHLDPGLIQAYILKGNALSALGRKEEALLVWQKGYENAVQQSADLKQLLELEELLSNAKQSQPLTLEEQVADFPIADSSITKENQSVVSEEHVIDSSTAVESSLGSGSEHILDSSQVIIPEDSEIPSKSDDGVEINSVPSEIIQVGPIKIVPKILASSKTKSKSISLDFRLSRGIAQVNEGKYDAAISIFNQILRENPTSPEALIGRGTAYAFQRELELAIADFTKAIKSNPSAGEAWKRRGQARAALGESVQAIEDLTKALEFEPNSSDILHERGIVCFKFKDYNSAVEDLSKCVFRERTNKSAYTYLGLALSAIGDYSQAEQAHLKSIQLDQNFLDGWIHLTQDSRSLHLELNFWEET